MSYNEVFAYKQMVRVGDKDAATFFLSRVFYVGEIVATIITTSDLICLNPLYFSVKPEYYS